MENDTGHVKGLNERVRQAREFNNRSGEFNESINLIIASRIAIRGLQRVLDKELRWIREQQEQIAANQERIVVRHIPSSSIIEDSDGNLVEGHFDMFVADKFVGTASGRVEFKNTETGQTLLVRDDSELNVSLSKDYRDV